MYLWNVSKSQYKEVAKISNYQVIGTHLLKDGSSNMICAIEDGSVLVYDLINRKKVFSIEPTHSETIFDLKFNKLTNNIFATCSFDSTVNIWDANKQTITKKLKIDKIEKSGASKEDAQSNFISLYCLCWSPSDENFLLTGDSLSFIRLWDISKGKVSSQVELSQNTNTKEKSVIGVDWNSDNDIIVGNQDDNIYHLKFVSGELRQENTIFKCGCSVFQVAFNPYIDGQFAAACFDNTVKIYNLNGTTDPIQTLTGHTKKVFGVAWNPRKSGCLASSSDDGTIGVYDLNSVKN